MRFLSNVSELLCLNWWFAYVHSLKRNQLLLNLTYILLKVNNFRYIWEILILILTVGNIGQKF